MDRRGFLKTVAGSVGLVALIPPGFIRRILASADPPSPIILFDANRCTGCGDCYRACKTHNGLPGEAGFDPDAPPPLSGDTWTTLVPVRRGLAWRFRKHACMHCTEASCQQVCPAGAITHRDGIVVIDQEWCVGCGYCVQACPFGVPQKDHQTGTARKCDFCAARVSAGQSPACVEVCPAEALYFGDLREMLTLAHSRLMALQEAGKSEAGVYGQDQLGGLRVLSLLDDRPAVYGLPETLHPVASGAGLQWLSGLTAVALGMIPLWLVFRKKDRLTLPDVPATGDGEKNRL